MNNPRYANELNGILISQDNDRDLYVDKGPLYDSIIAGGYGEIAPYVAPPEPTAAELLQAKREAATLTPMQFMLNVDAAGMMPAIEAYLAEPTTPNSFKIMWSRASSFERLYPDLVAAATELGITDAQMDAIFGIV